VSTLAVVGAVLLLAAVAAMAVLGGVIPDVRAFQCAYAAAFAGYGLIVWACLRHGGGDPDRKSGTRGGVSRTVGDPRTLPGRWPWWLAGAVAARIALLTTAPSDDVYRYAWEGRIQAAGFNPYVVAPDDPRLAGFRDDDWSHINHRDYPAIYPPLAELEFRLLAEMGAPLVAFKSVHAVWDCLTIVVLSAWLKAVGRPQHLAVVYALNPLVLTAFAVDGHVDSLMVLLLALCGWAAARQRWSLAGAALGGAVLAKLIPIVVLPWLVWRRHWSAAGVCVAVVAAGYSVYAADGLAVFDSLRRFAGTTACFSPTFPALVRVAGQYARLFAAIAILLVLGWGLRRGEILERYALRSFAVVILLSPVVHFWYLAPVLLFCAHTPRASWLVLSCTMLFYFAAEEVRRQTGAWAMPAWVPWAVYAPFAVMWMAASITSRLNAPGHPSPSEVHSDG